MVKTLPYNTGDLGLNPGRPGDYVRSGSIPVVICISYLQDTRVLVYQVGLVETCVSSVFVRHNQKYWQLSPRQVVPSYSIPVREIDV